MSDEERLNNLLQRAKGAAKGNYRVFDDMKKEIESLEIEQAIKNNYIRKLAAVLRV